MTASDLAQRLNARRSGTRWTSTCPAHPDRAPSLSIREGDDGRVLLHCHAGCTPEAVCHAIGIALRDLMPPGDHAGRHGIGHPRIAATYRYTDERGSVLYEVVRYDPKTFRQRRPDGHGGHIWDLKGVRRVLYCLPAVVDAVTQGQGIFVVEGERDCDTLTRLGLCATTNCGGAGKWRPEDSETLRGAHVAILPDNDDAGRQHAGQVARSLVEVARSVRIIPLPNLPPKGDVSDWLAQGGTKSELLAWARAAPLSLPVTHQPGEDASATGADDEVAAPCWPEMDRAAFIGPAGEFVGAVLPHTQADAAALLVQFLAGAGNVIGRKAFIRVEADEHPARLFVVLVGPTSSGGKGTSLGYVRRVLTAADPGWAEACMAAGLSSGEGVVFHVRDAHGNDPGVRDKRLLVIEAEFASVLRVARREGNTLLPTLRTAWDGHQLRLLTRNNPLKASNHHISVIGHCTAEELRKDLAGVECFAGTGNRFLWVCARRSKLLPFGGSLPPGCLDAIAKSVQHAACFVGDPHRAEFNAPARDVWAGVYADLVDLPGGIVGAMLARGPAQVLRIALCYALLDRATVIGVPQLQAALAVWRYCRASVEYLFPENAPADRIACKLLEVLGGTRNPMTTADLHRALAGHTPACEIAAALKALESAGRIERTAESTGGRRRTLYRTREVSERSAQSADRGRYPTPSSLSTLCSLSKHRDEPARSGEQVEAGANTCLALIPGNHLCGAPCGVAGYCDAHDPFADQSEATSA